MTATYVPRRNPIRRHGELVDRFVQIPNELARDSTLSHHAYRLAIALRSHRSGFETSGAALSEEYGWARSSVTKALRELEDAGWLVVQEYVNDRGKPVFREYHLHAARRFDLSEVCLYGETVVLPTAYRGESDEITPVESVEPWGWSDPGQEGGSGESIKEHQLEDFSEDQVKNTRGEPRCADSRCSVCRQFGRRQCPEHREHYSGHSMTTLVSGLSYLQDEPGW